jgi:membrane protease subunit HflK
MESVLANSTKVMLDVDAGNNLMVLPLEKLLGGRTGSDAQTPTPAELDRQQQSETLLRPPRDTSRTRGTR